MKRIVLLVAVALATALAVPAYADTGSTVVLVPSGDSAIDMPAIQAAIDSASPGDTIVLGSGMWEFGLHDPGFDTTIVAHPGAAGFPLAQFINAFLPGMADLRQVVVDKAITIQGDPSGGTVITDSSWTGAPYSHVSGFLVSNHAAPEIRDLTFRDIDVPIVSFGPMTIDGVTFDDYSDMWWFVDPRAIYPSYPEYTTPVKSSLTNSTFSGGVAYYTAFGLSEATISGNFFGAFADKVGPLGGFGVFQVTGKHIFEVLAGVPLDELSPELHRNVDFVRNTFRGTPGPGQTNRMFVGVELGAEDWGGVMENITVADNTFSNWELGNPFSIGTALAIEADNGVFGLPGLSEAEGRDVTVTSNLFEDLSCTDPLCQVFPGVGITALGVDETLQGGRPLSNVTFAGNVFSQLDNVNGFMEGVLLLGGVRNSSVIDNDFTQSGIPGLEAGSTASVAIFALDVFLPGLGAASDILVFQTPNTLPANSTIGSHFHNFGGTDVTVIGLANGHSGRPVGPQMQGIIEQRIGLGEYLRPGYGQ